MIHDFLIIGSGASGGVLAGLLTEAGANVALIEAGHHLNRRTFPKTEAHYSAQLFWGGGLEFDTQAHTAFLRARVVGGTTITNQCLLDRFDDEAWRDWKDRSGVDWLSVADMQPHYDALEHRMSLKEYEAADMNRNAQLFTKGSDASGYKWKFLHRGFDECKHREGNDCIACLGGCHRDSKQSSLVSFIQPALEKGLTLIPETEVQSIVKIADGWLVKGNCNGSATEHKTKKLILAGGSFGSTGLLLRSGFRASLPALGKGFCQHPQYMSYGVYDEPVDSHKGAFQTVSSGDPAFRAKGFKLENVFAPPISTAMLFPVFGKELTGLMRKFRHLACIEVAVRDQPEGGEIFLDNKGKMQVRKQLTGQDLKRRDDGLQAIDNILEKSGAKQVVRSPFFFGLHLMGGCSLGTDARTSVVDPEFRVHGTNDVYIADSSVFPSAPGINPSFTIMALSHRLATGLLNRN